MQVTFDWSNRRHRQAAAAFVLAGLNFIAFMLASLSLGGDALNGRHMDGHYFLSDHGRLTEVSAGIFRYSQVHGISVFVTHFAAFAAVARAVGASSGKPDMRTLEIAEIAIDEGGQLLIRPAEADDSFQHVYRGAADVRWDSARACFTCPKPGEWSYLRWFQQARGVVGSELGRSLRITSRTTWTNVAEALRDQISSAA